MTHDVPYVNLLPLRDRRARVRRILITRWVAGIALTLAGVGIPGIYLGGNAALSDPLIGVQIDRVRSQLGTNEAEIPRLQKRIAVLEEKKQTLDLVRNKISWQDLFAHIVSASHEQIHFTSLFAEGGGVEGDEPIRIQVVGVAISQTDARSYVVELESLGLFDRVELLRTSRQELNDQEIVEFHIQAVVGEIEGGTP